MTSRGAAATFVASLVLVVVSLGLWATADAGVGTDLERVTATSSTAAGGVGPVRTGDGEGDVDKLPSSSPARTEGLPAASAVPRADATRIAAPQAMESPRRVAIPSVGIRMAVEATGVRKDGQMELPEDPRTIGWYQFGASPGDDRGSAVLGGHVDSVRYGVGPLARLAGVEVGARIIVTGSEGERLRYRVTSIERISKAALPTDRIFAPDVAHRLVVVTCGGRYLPEAGGYEDNIVVVAKPVS